jgi:hypothetical protein
MRQGLFVEEEMKERKMDGGGDCTGQQGLDGCGFTTAEWSGVE